MNKQFPSFMRPKELVLANGKKVYKKRSYSLIIVLLIALLIYWSGRMTGFDLQVLIKRGEEFFVILKRMVPPNTAYFKEVIPPLLDTIKMSVLGTFIGALLAIPYAMWSATNLTRNHWITSLLKLLLSLIRTLPTLVSALILTYIFGLGTFAGTLAIALFTFSFVTKQLYGAIETADMSPYEAMEALGAIKLYSFLGAIKPQVLPSYLSVVLYTFEGNVRHAAILGYVGAGGIGIILDENLGWREYQNVGMILLCLFFTVVVIESISRYLRTRLT